MTQQITVKVETMGAVLLRNVVPVLFIAAFACYLGQERKGEKPYPAYWMIFL
ncbi:MAG: hypothetical protein V8S98_03870 [Lachnospiraceae bacterium]